MCNYLFLKSPFVFQSFLIGAWSCLLVLMPPPPTFVFWVNISAILFSLFPATFNWKGYWSVRLIVCFYFDVKCEVENLAFTLLMDGSALAQSTKLILVWKKTPTKTTGIHFTSETKVEQLLIVNVNVTLNFKFKGILCVHLWLHSRSAMIRLKLKLLKKYVCRLDLKLKIFVKRDWKDSFVLSS